ncbi:hypothetical protein RJ55_00236 [Drechmeria coniospora]|nr:hypothetical protein RJ55_00236 [Drechmeria coniospora]
MDHGPPNKADDRSSAKHPQRRAPASRAAAGRASVLSGALPPLGAGMNSTWPEDAFRTFVSPGRGPDVRGHRGAETPCDHLVLACEVVRPALRRTGGRRRAMRRRRNRSTSPSYSSFPPCTHSFAIPPSPTIQTTLVIPVAPRPFLPTSAHRRPLAARSRTQADVNQVGAYRLEPGWCYALEFFSTASILPRQNNSHRTPRSPSNRHCRVEAAADRHRCVGLAGAHDTQNPHRHPLSSSSPSASPPRAQIPPLPLSSPPPSIAKSAVDIDILPRAAMAFMSPVDTSAAPSGTSSNGGSVSPRLATTPKNVAFELMFSNSPQYRARLPMRVQIYPHDTTDSIVTTVKNFYGLYSGPSGSRGVSFEDDSGNTLIARYENFHNNMVVYVRVIEEPPSEFAPHALHASRFGSEAYHAADGHDQPQPQRLEHEIGRPGSRASRRRSPSPGATRGRSSDSHSTSSKKGRSQSAKDRKPIGTQADGYSESLNGYDSADGAPSTASGKNKDQLGNTDISVDNIVEGGRRKRAKFESSVRAVRANPDHLLVPVPLCASLPVRTCVHLRFHLYFQELPLFAPPQMPAATSNPSVSPARRVEHHRPSLPFVHPGQNPFTNPRPMQSPQNSHAGPAFSGLYTTPAPHGHRSRGSIGYVSNGSGSGAGLGVLPTPDPTVGSCMSEEDKDVAIQLMRLGESSNVSHGRTSASTLDDTFSGKADAASSTGATSDGESESEDELPAARRQKLDAPDGAKRIYQTTEAHFIPTTEVVGGGDAKVEDGAGTPAVEGKPFPARKQPAAKQKSASAAPKAATQKAKAARPAGLKTKKASAPPASATSGPMSPASTTHSRKPSVASVGHVAQAGGEEDHPDLSTKPRCQRCRKSKKGCDRQRPCGRCRDAGLSADQCISEDEGNGRKGRYGRHMGVPLKKDEAQALTQPALLPAAPITMAASTTTDKARKRKR